MELILCFACCSSGPVLLALLNILERYDLDVIGPVINAYQRQEALFFFLFFCFFPNTFCDHYDCHHEMLSMTEAFKFGFAQRSYLGDPDFVSYSLVPFSETRLCFSFLFLAFFFFFFLQVANVSASASNMINKDWASQVRRLISMVCFHSPLLLFGFPSFIFFVFLTQVHTYPPGYYGGNFAVQATPGTTHISALDRNGQAASLTSTVSQLQTPVSPTFAGGILKFSSSLTDQPGVGFADSLIDRNHLQQ